MLCILLPNLYEDCLLVTMGKNKQGGNLQAMNDKDEKTVERRMGKFQHLAEELRELLQSGTFDVGERFYSEHMLCRKYDVSRQTVRKALQTLEDEGLLERVQGSGTYVKELLARETRNRSMNVAVIVTYLSDYIFPVILKEMEKVFTASGYFMSLFSTGNSVAREREILRAISSKEIDGLILEPTKSALPNPNLALYQQMEKNGVPIVFINAAYPALDAPLVALHDQAAGKLATRALIEKSHTKIGAILKADDLQGHERYAGIMEAMYEAGLKVNDENFYWYTTEDLPFSHEEGQVIVERVKDCTGIVTYNDNVALQAMAYFEQAGINVPVDLSISSIDDSKWAQFGRIRLTSVHNPLEELGETAARQLLNRIEDTNYKAGVRFEPRLVERESIRSMVDRTI